MFVKKTIMTLFGTIAATLTLAAQPQQSAPVPPDDETILARTADSGSPYYYPELMSRYRAGDTTLTGTDYYFLYYGYAFTDDYRPLEPIPEEQQALEAFRKTYDNPSALHAAELIACAEAVLQKDPFSLSNINFLIYACGMNGDSVGERTNYDRLNKLIAAISSSGTGLTEDSPIHILRFAHANDLLGVLDLDIVKRLVVSRTTEYVSVADRSGHRTSKGYYFDYSRIYRGGTPQPAERQKWKFNNYPLGGTKK